MLSGTLEQRPALGTSFCREIGTCSEVCVKHLRFKCFLHIIISYYAKVKNIPCSLNYCGGNVYGRIECALVGMELCV